MIVKKKYNPNSGYQKGHIPWSKGIKLSKEIRAKMSLAQIGNKKTLGFKHSEEECVRRSVRMKKHPSKGQFKVGVPKSKEIKDKISKTLKLRYKTNKENTGNWQGGKSSEEYSPLFNQQLKDRARVRDNFICQLCGVPELEGRRRLDIHHIDYDKKNTNIDNLVALCQKCHLKTNFNRDKWLLVFNRWRSTFKAETHKPY